jgi:UDP-N-acetylmuramoyl-tripeptide--D-alanyl-D-alanine ligase
MISLALSDIAKITGGTLVGEDITISSIGTDSRALQTGDVFLALSGPNFDGHKFINQVIELGCSAVIVEHQLSITMPESAMPSRTVPQVIVSDCRIALGQIGAYVKQSIAPKTVGITGSSGKTTVKEMTAAILKRLGKVLATKGNFNNDIGVPLTLLRLEQDHQFAVIEMGANHAGEIAYTANLVKPDVAIINNIAAAHLEGFGDLCGVAKAKGEIFSGLAQNAVAIYNQDSDFCEQWQWRLNDKKVRRFSARDQADCYSSEVTLDVHGCASFTLHSALGQTVITLAVPGEHNVNNALAAASVAIEFGATLQDISLGLGDMVPVPGRLNLHQLGEHSKLIDDTYNANVESTKAATELLASYPGKRILILGDMGELGSQARHYHQQAGEYAKSLGIDSLLTLGVLSQSSSDAFAENGQHFSTREQLIANLGPMLAQQSTTMSILVKGSRSAHMEHVVQAIIELYNHQNIRGHS